MGHSIAGEELSSVGSRYPERVAGLIYLDAAYSYAYYYRGVDSFDIDAAELRHKLDQLAKGSTSQTQLVEDLLQKNLPVFERDLQEIRELDKAAPAKPVRPLPRAGDLASFPAFRVWVKRTQGIYFPEAELRETHESAPGGGVGKARPGSASDIIAGEQKYENIRVPVLAVYANPKEPSPYTYKTPAERAAVKTILTRRADAEIKAFQAGVPSAHIVRVAHANHYVFLSNESDVLREMNAFLAALPQ